MTDQGYQTTKHRPGAGHRFVTKRTQRATYDTEIALLEKKRPVPANSSIVTLNSFLDNEGILRVGGRIGNAEVSNNMKHPVIIPQQSHLALLLVRHHHNKVYHQGRLITEAVIRSRGFWIIGAKRLVLSIIHKCVLCRKLRGKFKGQRMADLPTDRVSAVAPFTVVGVDTLGPWTDVARKTRGGHSENKRWAILFTCLATRAVHTEVIAEMSSWAFINALSRFVALRGPVREFRSDRGTNFVGALDDIHAKGICVEKSPVNKHLLDSVVVWKFNPPHASHMGGIWERLIGLARRILDSMLLKSHNQRLTHEVLSAVINSRPIAPLSYNPKDPEVISPAVLITQKKEPLQGLDTSVNIRDIYKHQRKHVQVLANTFWKRWRDGYLQTLQVRRKWSSEQQDLKTRDIVLVKDAEEYRNHWPLGIVINTFPSGCDVKVRSVEVRVSKSGKSANYVRPITELILLVE